MSDDHAERPPGYRTGSPPSGARPAAAAGAQGGGWDGARVRALHEHVAETQAEFADRIGTTQQTVSGWERGARQPRRMAQRLLRLVAEQSAFYDAAPPRGAPARSGPAMPELVMRDLVMRALAMPSAIAEAPARQWASAATGVPRLREHELVALWLLGRVPPELLPWPLLRPGRGGRGPGPDVREAAFRSPEGVVRSGAVEVHLAASDFVRHGHDRDPAYGALVLHLVWLDDRIDAGTPQASSAAGAAPQPCSGRGAAPQALPGGGAAPTCVVGPALGGDPAALRRLLRLGPSGAEPCVEAARSHGGAATSAAVRAEGRRRLAELAWRAAALASEHGWDGAWRLLLLRALAASAGRRAETAGVRAALATQINGALGGEPLRRLVTLALDQRPGPLVEALRGGTLGRGRAAELGWNAALPLLAAQAAAFGDLALARSNAALIEAWPAPRPYGRTRALRDLLGPPPPRTGALHGPGPAAPPGPLVRTRRLRRLPPIGRPRRH